MINVAMNNSIDVVEEYQKEIMGSLDQLDDLLAFTEFKETQTDIIRQISTIIQTYIKEKPRFNDHFFKLIPNQSHNKCIGIQIEFTMINLVIISTLYEAIPSESTTNR